MKKVLVLALALVLALGCMAAFAEEKTDWIWPASMEELFVGYSQADLASTWRTVESDNMQEVADALGVKLSIVNAEGDTGRQISDVESLVAQGCNVIVITPLDADAIQPALEYCAERQIPVICKSRGCNGVVGKDYVTFVGSDFVNEGELAGTWIKNAAEAKGLEQVRLIEVQGVIGGTDVRDRSAGFHNVVDAAGYETIAQQSANWSRTEAQEVVANVIQATGGAFEAVYCQNDEMALGATLALQNAGMVIGEDVFLVGVDGMYEAFDAIKEGTLCATVTCSPKSAEFVFDVIKAGMNGEEIDGFVQVTDYLVDATNVEEYYDKCGF